MTVRKFVLLLFSFMLYLYLAGCGNQPQDPAGDPSMDNSVSNEQLKNNSPLSDQPAKVSIANEEKVLNMLKNEGILPEDATPEEIDQTLKNYLSGKNQVKKNSKPSIEP